MKAYNCIDYTRTTEDVFRVVNYSIKNKTDKCFELTGSASDVRDIRVRAQRALAELHDIEFWEPETLTKHQLKQIAVLQTLIANCKQYEGQTV